ncbi:hypothetical protein POM88_024722 [Heracleum sosnowskyi]|uniref:Uncharacterized protein n=1 Tax=Heracleum sosnowskyi TaxID=360622 RepID=A0AAD8I3D7_9APIA|nr:hypothetical protein POM88_024722 [Heracleum sosnowskyi]
MGTLDVKARIPLNNISHRNSFQLIRQGHTSPWRYDEVKNKLNLQMCYPKGPPSHKLLVAGIVGGIFLAVFLFAGDWSFFVLCDFIMSLRFCGSTPILSVIVQIGAVDHLLLFDSLTNSGDDLNIIELPT